MFANVVRLEFTKQRRAFLSVIFLAITFLFFIFVDSLIHSRNLLEVYRDIIGYFAIFGVAGLIILTGPVAGAQLRSEAVRNAEDSLPFSPTQKVFGAYLTSLIYVLVGSIFFLAFLFALNSLNVVDLTLDTIISWHYRIRPEVFLLLVLQFHLLSFLFAYWINQSVIGIALAGLVVGSEIIILLQANVLTDVYWFAYPESSWLTWIFGVLVGLIGGCLALAGIGRKVERSSRTFLLPGLAASIAVCGGSIFLLCGFFITSYRLQNRLLPANLSWPNRLIESPKMQLSGAFFYSMSGDLVQVTAEKKFVLRNTSFRLKANKEPDIAGYFFDGDSSFFLLKKESGKYEIWKASEDGKFEHYRSFLSTKVELEFMFQCGEGICLYSFAKNESFIVFSKMESNFPQNQNIEWQRLPIPKGSYGFATIVQDVLNSQVGKYRLAQVSDSKNILTRTFPSGKNLQWNLPGVAITSRFVGSIIVPAYEKAGEPYYVLPVSANGRTTFIQCSPDGSVRPAWNDSFPSSEEVTAKKIAGSGMVWFRWVDKKVTELRTVTSDGTFYKPTKLPPNQGLDWPTPLKIEGKAMWLLSEKNLMKIDLTNGKILFDSGPLSDSYDVWSSYTLNPSKEGVYFVRDKRICLIDWNGKVRDIASATVN
jgi:hypothetical protein